MKSIKKWQDLEILFDGLYCYISGYVILNKKAYYKYQDKINKVVKENKYKIKEHNKYIYVLKNWKL